MSKELDSCINIMKQTQGIYKAYYKELLIFKQLKANLKKSNVTSDDIEAYADKLFELHSATAQALSSSADVAMPLKKAMAYLDRKSKMLKKADYKKSENLKEAQDILLSV